MTGSRRASPDRQFWIALARASGGAIFFSLPLLMTMEMWTLGAIMPRVPLILLMVVMFPILVGLSHFAGFEETESWLDDTLDAAVAYGVGFTSSAGVLWMFDIIGPGTPLREGVGIVALQAVPASFGACLASAEFGAGDDQGEERKDAAGYGGELFLMLAGSLFLAFNVAPTEEMSLLEYKMTGWHAVALAIASLVVMHAFVYSVEFRGSAKTPEGVPAWSTFLRFTVPGYAVALLASAYVLWTFGRLEGTSVMSVVSQAVVLAFPASLGASAARLVL